MIIEKILKQLTPERVKKEVEAVKGVKLPPELQKWVDKYNKVGERPEFIWKWLYKVNKIWIYFPIQVKYSRSLITVKTLYNMFIVLLDDVAETRGKEKLLNELLKIPFKKESIKVIRLKQKEERYLEFTQRVWRYIQKTVQQYPRYKRIKDYFDYDTAQFINAVKYAYLVYKNPYFVNSTECWLYIPHSMQILIDFDLDLMCSAKFDFEDLGRARKTVLCLQEMGRIGNWLTTWERELKENDFTSVVIAYSLENKIITFKSLLSRNKNRSIEKIKNSPTENFLLKKGWENRYKALNELSKKSKIINTKEILKRAKYLIFMHLLSRGWK